jgi:hypothetical protein
MPVEVGKVTLKSTGEEALIDVPLQKSYKALNKVSVMKH